MKKPTHYFKITLFTVLIFGLNQSCELDDLSESEANQVSEQDAQRVAENLLFPDTDRSDTASFRLNKDDYTTQKSVSTIDAITGRSSDPLFYVVNYDNGGFAIISGDKRIEPVLAYSKHSNFPIEDKMSLPPGLVDWLEDYAAIVLEVRKENVSPSVRISSMWERILETQFNIDFLEILTCEDGSIDFGEYVEKKILLDTEWSQGCGYNLFLADSCTPRCNRPPVGCVATAIAQILKYHADKSWGGAYMIGSTGGNQGNAKSLDWANMPLTGVNQNNHGDIPELMEDLGIFLLMNYSCSGSGTNYTRAFNTITNDFNFNGTQRDVNGLSDYTIILNDIKDNQPVYMRGNETRVSENLKGELEESYPGHGWVADGYSRFHQCRSGFTDDFKIHMNWGWGGNHDGYYVKKEGSFDENRQIIYNITP